MNSDGFRTGNQSNAPSERAGSSGYPQLRRGRYRVLTEHFQVRQSVELTEGQWVNVGRDHIRDSGFHEDHFQIFFGKTNSHIIALQPLGVLGGHLAPSDSAAFDQGVQVVSSTSGNIYFIVEGNDELVHELDEERGIDMAFNSCTECLTHGKCFRCGGTGLTVTTTYVDGGATRYEEQYCRRCTGQGKCLYCREMREVILAAAQLIADGQYVRADAILDASLAKLNAPRTLGVGSALLKFGASLLLDFNSSVHERVRTLQKADLLFQKAHIRMRRNQVTDAIPYLQEALQNHPSQIAAVNTLKELRL